VVRRTPAPSKASDPRPALFPSDGVEIPAERRMTKGALLLYFFPTAFWYRDAATILEHVGSFERYSEFEIRPLNTDGPIPRDIAELDFQLVIVHYSIFGSGMYQLSEDHLRFLSSSRGYKVLFAQDEHRYCGHRFWFLDEAGFDCMYTLLEPPQFEKVYGRYTRVPSIRTNLPGYVGDEMLDRARRFALPDAERSIDVGYRGRPLPVYSGHGAQEKAEIGWRFAELAADSGLELDILVGEQDRLYGDDWYRFMASCRAMLGVESGVSVFDLDDRVIDEYERLLARGGPVTAEDLTEVEPHEDQVFYRTISPRHFEAAAFRVCQILFEGHYSGLMEPMVHYIPLRKDYSNLEQVLDLFRDPEVRREITENAHRDLIASRRYTYESFIEGFDRNLLEAGLVPGVPPGDVEAIDAAFGRGRRRRWLRGQLWWGYQRWIASSWVAVVYYRLRGGLAKVARTLLRRPEPSG
jgi:hypothetical protein